MKKFLVPAMIVLATAASVNAQAAKPSDNLSRHALGEAKDTRSAWAKSQDMYIEPTLRMTETTVPVTPDQAQQQNMNVQAVPAGSVPATGTSQTTVIGPNGQPVPAQGNNGAPVQDLSRPQP
ncbi:hypothetical protein W822_15065 [Advenella kashmirensis W13003]|uniref:Uncharacterized protein n=1 Tax=Advenella kashmirensis W13003 TaxID=1424334 RepID=V8QTR2_9BURK|nr:hypothetical protein [Advenella kashmirensis]ETF02399.1 hypothetical protein W822_15065 [Advenella kashmirensis W13003]